GVAGVAARLLLQGGRHERRARAPGIGLALDAADLERDALQPLGEAARGLLVELQQGLVAQLPVLPDVPARRNSAAVERGELSLERIRREGRPDVPPRRADEGPQPPPAPHPQAEPAPRGAARGTAV